MSEDLRALAGAAQSEASDPDASVFVTANAGSGKTTTLVDRVARLLLAEARPETILCVTYTKAAAAEMQRRLFERLGHWSVMPDDDLRGALARLQTHDPADYGAKDLSDARSLFARALESPGGLKIQTIHAFCERLLRRFPLEAGVSPGFTVMDDAAAAEIAREARDAVAQMALKGEGAIAEAYGRFSVALAFDDFQAMFSAIEDQRAAIAAYVARCGGPAGVVADVWARCGFEEPTDPNALEAAAVAAADLRFWTDAAAVLAETGKPADAKNAASLRAVAEAIREERGQFEAMLAALFIEKGVGKAADWVAKGVALRARPNLQNGLLDEQDRLARAREEVRAARVAADTVSVLTLAAAYGEAYRLSKQMSGALDFADLILTTSALLTEKADAAWVLYKLDGGIDHVLVDEAQDTAPDQWTILKALTAEFFAGLGAVDMSRMDRSLFVVGDEKQSIYSFQGAAPEQLMAETEAFLGLILEAGQQGRLVPLLASWRSADQVLRFIDALFGDPETSRGVPPPRGETVLRHLAVRGGDGCVDLWPLDRDPPGEVREAWDEPLDAEGAGSANRVLAARIAREISDLTQRADAVFDKDTRTWRPAGFGDVLILVRRRSALFEDIIRALKRAGVPVAGADRLSLSEHIVFDDLMALGRFALYPDDDLTLAALLRSPFCDLDEDSLFALAHKRPGSLWSALRTRAEERPEWASAFALLEGLRLDARVRRPFEFYARLLGLADARGRSMRARVLTRIGAEAGDVLDEFLTQTLNAERNGVTDLERLMAAFAKLNITVKRELEGPRGEVRVMTVHGAKGLEAPIVILPETTVTRGPRGTPLMQTEDGGFLWCAAQDRDCQDSAAARALRQRKADEEAQRLLYVGLTRARDRLILCGRIGAKAKLETVGGWYGAAERALDHADVAPEARTLTQGDLTFRRYGPDPQTLPPAVAVDHRSSPLPAWALRLARPEAAPARYASPSTLLDEEPGLVPSPLSRVGGLGRYRRGALIHHLLQLLPDVSPEARPTAAEALLSREADLTPAQRREMAEAALGVLSNARFAAVFGPGSRAEVALAGGAAGLPARLAISGRVDRLVVEPDRILVADFKTNRPSPDRIEDADPAYLTQMAVYCAVLAEIFPGRRIEAALVWTDGPKLMAVPENMVAQALAQLRAGS